MTTISNRPINISPIKTVAAPTQPAPQTTAAVAPLPVNTDGIFGLAPNTAKTAVVLGLNLGRLSTMPVIGQIIASSVKSGFGLSNILWTAVPSAFRNVTAVAKHSESAGRGAANVGTEVAFSIGKGIVSGVAVQAVSVAMGPILGLITIPAAILPFVGIAIGLGSMMLAYKVMNTVIKHTKIDQKMANGITNLLGGDLKPAK
ncbi:MAG: hypothetical protein JWM80_1688 [Cyanobacteria bacterium RYN_339]|nr:hypothetical protein [Cyanobacteria bacterium RYN_339]